MKTEDEYDDDCELIDEEQELIDSDDDDDDSEIADDDELIDEDDDEIADDDELIDEDDDEIADDDDGEVIADDDEIVYEDNDIVNGDDIDIVDDNDDDETVSDFKAIKKKKLILNIVKIKSTYKNYKYYKDTSSIDTVLREKVKQQLFELLDSKKNSETFEKYLFILSTSFVCETSSDLKIVYMDNARNLIGYLLPLENPSEKNLTYVLDILKQNKLNYKSEFYETYDENIKQELKKVQIPVEIIEGIFSCPKCHQKFTQHYSIQTRRSDEPPTIFIHCLTKGCLHKWRKG